MTTTPKPIPALTVVALTSLALTVLAIAAVAALPSPAQAQVRREPWIPVSTNNVFWGLALGPVILDPVFPQPGWAPAYGAAGRVPPGAPVPGRAYVPRILDCVHIPFPQCGAN